MSGYVKLHRQLAEHPLWLRGRFSPGQAWADLLMRANYHDGRVLRGNLWVAVRRGQVFTSQQALAARWRWDRKTVRGFLDALKTDGMLGIETSHATDTGFTLLTICNYERYQGPAEDGTDTRPDSHPDTRLGDQRTVNGQSLPTSEEVKKEKNTTTSSGSPNEPRPHAPVNGSGNGHRNGHRPYREQAREVLGFLNLKTGRDYRPVDSTLKLIEGRLRSGVTVEACRGVVARKVREWSGDPKMARYLRPETLFNPTKFESYLGERLPSTSADSSHA